MSIWAILASMASGKRFPVMLQVFKIVTQRRNVMSGGEVHKGAKGRCAKLCGAVDGSFSLAETIKGKNLRRSVRDIAYIELS
jgi:hypothetical protein